MSEEAGLCSLRASASVLKTVTSFVWQMLFMGTIVTIDVEYGLRRLSIQVS